MPFPIVPAPITTIVVMELTRSRCLKRAGARNIGGPEIAGHGREMFHVRFSDRAGHPVREVRQTARKEAERRNQDRAAETKSCAGARTTTAAATINTSAICAARAKHASNGARS